MRMLQLVVVLLIWGALGQSWLAVMALPANVGESSSDLTAGADQSWRLMVEAGQGELSDRRITPKSVFIAPALGNRSHRCRDGYRLDHLGRCVKIMRIDPASQLELILKRLRETKIKTQPPLPKPLGPPSTGPLHFSIPLAPIPPPSTEPTPTLNLLPVRKLKDTDEASGFGALTTTASDLQGSGVSPEESDTTTVNSVETAIVERSTETTVVHTTEPTLTSETTTATWQPLEGSGETPTATELAKVDDVAETGITRIIESPISKTTSTDETGATETTIATTTDGEGPTERSEHGENTSTRVSDSDVAETTRQQSIERLSTPANIVEETTSVPFLDEITRTELTVEGSGSTVVLPPEDGSTNTATIIPATRPQNEFSAVATTKSPGVETLRIVVPPVTAINNDNERGGRISTTPPPPEVTLADSSRVSFPDDKVRGSSGTTSDPFWWLPHDWNEEENRPTILKFWSKVPVIQDEPPTPESYHRDYGYGERFEPSSWRPVITAPYQREPPDGKYDTVFDSYYDRDELPYRRYGAGPVDYRIPDSKKRISFPTGSQHSGFRYRPELRLPPDRESLDVRFPARSETLPYQTRMFSQSDDRSDRYPHKPLTEDIVLFPQPNPFPNQSGSPSENPRLRS